jgi:hypothetical protein
MWKNSLNQSSIITKCQVACVSIYFNKWKMKHMDNNFNMLKMNNLTHVHMLTFKEMWKNH